ISTGEEAGRAGVARPRRAAPAGAAAGETAEPRRVPAARAVRSAARPPGAAARRRAAGDAPQAAAGPPREAGAGRGDAPPRPGGRRLCRWGAAAVGGVHDIARPVRAGRVPRGGDAHPARAPGAARPQRQRGGEAMSTEKYFTYRGDVRAVAAVGDALAFVTAHPEGEPTAVYRLDPEKVTLTQDALPVGGVALLAAGGGLLVRGPDPPPLRPP